MYVKKYRKNVIESKTDFFNFMKNKTTIFYDHENFKHDIFAHNDNEGD